MVSCRVSTSSVVLTCANASSSISITNRPSCPISAGWCRTVPGTHEGEDAIMRERLLRLDVDPRQRLARLILDRVAIDIAQKQALARPPSCAMIFPKMHDWVTDCVEPVAAEVVEPDCASLTTSPEAVQTGRRTTRSCRSPDHRSHRPPVRQPRDALLDLLSRQRGIAENDGAAGQRVCLRKCTRADDSEYTPPRPQRQRFDRHASGTPGGRCQSTCRPPVSPSTRTSPKLRRSAATRQSRLSL